MYGAEESYRLDKEGLYQFAGKRGWRPVEGAPVQSNSTACFVDALQGIEAPGTGPHADRHSRDGLRALRILEAVHRAGRTGQVVEVEGD